jgi:hypothetical protein
MSHRKKGVIFKWISFKARKKQLNFSRERNIVKNVLAFFGPFRKSKHVIHYVFPLYLVLFSAVTPYAMRFSEPSAEYAFGSYGILLIMIAVASREGWDI